jgi:hypothetical protein
MGQIIQLQELHQARRRRSEKVSMEHCVELLEWNLKKSIDNYFSAANRAPCARRKQAGEILEYALSCLIAPRFIVELSFSLVLIFLAFLACVLGCFFVGRLKSLLQEKPGLTAADAATDRPTAFTVQPERITTQSIQQLGQLLGQVRADCKKMPVLSQTQQNGQRLDSAARVGRCSAVSVVSKRPIGKIYEAQGYPSLQEITRAGSEAGWEFF